MARNFLLLISLGQLLFGSEQFWFSYKIVTANSAVIHEEKNIATATILISGNAKNLCTIALQNKQNIPLKQFLTAHYDTLLPCFYSRSSHILSWNDKRTKESEDRVEVVIEPVRFTVDFKEEFATINTF